MSGWPLAVAETNAFKKDPKHGRVRHPLISTFRDHRRAALCVVGTAMAGNLCIYLWLVLFIVAIGMVLSSGFAATCATVMAEQFICSEDYARKHDMPPVFIRASSIVSASSDGSGELVAVRAAREAYEAAGYR